MEGRKMRLWVAGAGLLACLGCGGGASTYFRQGRKAELHKDYDTALVNYEKALQQQPDNASFLLHERLVRNEASLFHLKQGRRLLTENRTDDAIGEFQKAASINPANQAAAQELARLLTVQAAAKRAREKLIQQALQAREGGVTPGVRLKPLPTDRIPHIRFTGDSKQDYQTLAKLAALNVAFTNDFRPSPTPVDLSDVTLEEALTVVAHESKTFWKAITTNTILVIPDSPNNRRDYEDEVLKTIYLSNPLEPADRTAITTALKQILGLQRILDNPDSNAIIIRDTPAKVAAAEQMVRDLDRGKAEILIEVAVIEADRERVRDLGLTQVPSTPLPATGVLGVGFNPATSVTVTGTGGTTTTVPFLSLYDLIKRGLNNRDFSVVVPGAVANALLSDTHTRILQNPSVRVTDGQKATVKIGNRVPFATGSFLPSFGGAITGGGAGTGLGLLASTNFQYQDVGVNLDLKPHLLSSGEIALHAKIEISSVGASVTVGGVNEPTFGQRVIEHDIRLKEGEVNLLGGLIQSTTTRAISGLPGLGQIPGLRYLFSSEHTDRADTEVLVMLTPRLIRLPEIPLGAEKSVPISGSPTGPETVPQPQPFEAPPAEPPPGQPQ